MRFLLSFELAWTQRKWETGTDTPSLLLFIHLSSPAPSIYPIHPCVRPLGAIRCALYSRAQGFLWLLTTCCRQIVLSVLVHYCTFSCFSQHIKCIKDQWNSATNKDSTTADRVDGWSTAREKFDPLCIMFLCVSACVHGEDSTHKAQRGGINSTLLRVEPGRHVRWNFSPQRALIWLWFKAMCILSDISLWHKGSFFFVAKYQLSYMSMNDWPWLLYILWFQAPVLTTVPSIFKKPCQEMYSMSR